MNTDKPRSKVSNSEYERLKNKYPQMAQNFENVKMEAYEPQLERLGYNVQNNTQPRGKFYEQDEWQDSEQDEGQGQTS